MQLTSAKLSKEKIEECISWGTSSNMVGWLAVGGGDRLCSIYSGAGDAATSTKWGTFEGGEKVVDKFPLKSVIQGFNGMSTTIWLFPRPKRVQGTNPSISRLSRKYIYLRICELQ